MVEKKRWDSGAILLHPLTRIRSREDETAVTSCVFSVGFLPGRESTMTIGLGLPYATDRDVI